MAVSGVALLDDAYAAATGADAVVLMTEWEAYRTLDLDHLANAMRGRLLLDGRNALEPAAVAEAGLVYEGIGRPSQVASRLLGWIGGRRMPLRPISSDRTPRRGGARASRWTVARLVRAPRYGSVNVPWSEPLASPRSRPGDRGPGGSPAWTCAMRPRLRLVEDDGWMALLEGAERHGIARLMYCFLLKRWIDAAVAVLTLAVLSPAPPGRRPGDPPRLAGADPFRQHRIGKGGKPFVVLKFRTMTAGPVGDLRLFVGSDGRAAAQDPRRPAHHPGGKLLRRTSLDELRNSST